ncbi:MAG: acyl-ACP--UDP-N-acetylglucosamine O-acyltransferase [Phycisphaerales bacterium]|nr:acyl-ACP--UDP-N-acetylglucosamine O-acyltransferase [Phycisphaerales bacterium]
MATIHDTAIVDSTARISDEATIGPYCVIGPEVEIGPGTVLQNHVTVQCHSRIGANNLFYPFAVIGADPQDKKFDGEPTECLIGDNNEIREHVTIHRGTGNGGGVTSIGDDNLIMVGCHIAHDCRIGNGTVIANQVMLAGHVVIGDAAGIGGGAGVHHYVTIGQSAFVGGMARVSRDVPPYMIVEGHPAEVRAVNVIGMSRRGFSSEHVDAMKETFRRLFRENSNMVEGLAAVRLEFSGVPAIDAVCQAIEDASGGTHGRARESTRRDDKWAGAAGCAVAETDGPK